MDELDLFRELHTREHADERSALQARVEALEAENAALRAVVNGHLDSYHAAEPEEVLEDVPVEETIEETTIEAPEAEAVTIIEDEAPELHSEPVAVEVAPRPVHPFFRPLRRGIA